jgi:hypothetical protein
MARPMQPVTRVDIHLSGPTGYLHEKVRLPTHLVSDIPAVFAGAQALNPTVDAAAFFRTVLRLGVEAVRRNNERRVPIRWADLPHARQEKDAEAAQARQQIDTRSGLRPSRI